LVDILCACDKNLAAYFVDHSLVA